MSSYRINLNENNNKKTAKDFTDIDKKALFKFLEKHPEDQNAIEFAMKWFNCGRMTLIHLTIEECK